MKRLLFFLFAFFAIGSSVLAEEILQDVISVDDVEITPGGEVEVTVKLVNPPTDGLRSVSFDLYLPDGFTIKKKNANKQNVIVNLSDDQDEAFQATGKTVKENGVENLQRIRFAILSVTDNEALLEVGDLFSFYLVADEDINIDNYQAILGGQFAVTGNITLTGHVGSITYYQPPYTFNIKMPIELSEEKSYAEGFGNYTDVKVIMNKRTLKADTWNTICFPFDMDADAIKKAFGEDNTVTIATLMGSETKKKNGKVHSIVIKFDTKSTTEISANTPYLIKLSEAVDVFAVDGVSLSDNQSPVSVTGGDCTFYGNYDVIENLGADTPVLFISGNNFYYATGNTTMKSFRGYFTHPDLAEYIQNKTAGANITLFVDDEPTGIRNIVTNQGGEDVYDISGRKVNNDNLQKGVYIVNGKKQTVH